MNTSRHLLLVPILLSLVWPSTPAFTVKESGFRPQPPFEYQAYIVSQFDNDKNTVVYLRRGWFYVETPNSGFGWDKITRKHNISNIDILRYVVGSPTTFRKTGGRRWEYRGSFTRYIDETPVDSRFVRVIVEYGDFHSYGELGVVTAFCEQGADKPKCPGWINTVNPKPNRRSLNNEYVVYSSSPQADRRSHDAK